MADSHELHVRRVKSYPPDHLHPDFPPELQSASTLTTLAEHDPAPGSKPLSLHKRVRPLRPLVGLVAFSSTFTILNCLFVYFVLIREYVETPGGVRWDATKTNYIVALLSQISAILTDATIKAVLTATRPMLAVRAQGSSWASWVAMGSSGWSTILQVSAANMFLNPWCLVRLVLPVLALGIGSIVKFNADFGYYFLSHNTTMDVYAGLTTVSVKALNLITTADLSMYLSMFSTSLLTNSMFAQPFAMEGCNYPCRSVALPGSVGTARQVKPYLNSSIYSTPFFSNDGTIRFDNASGFVVRYDPAPPATLNFNITTECVYSGQQIHSGLQICFRQSNISLLVGWSACPKSLLDADICNSSPNFSPPAWRTSPITSGTLMSLYRISTTTSYDRSTQSILDIHPLTEPSPVPLSAENYTAIFTRALVPRPNASVDDTNGAGALIHQLAWMHRTYNKTFPDDQNSPVAMLQNVLAVPIQFAVTAEVYANYSSTEAGRDAVLQFPLPDEMITTARGGEASTKLGILKWAGWLFIAVDGVVHLAAVVWIGWAFRCSGMKRDGFGEIETGVAEVDEIRAAERARVVWCREKGWWGMMRDRVLWWKRRIIEDEEKMKGEKVSLLDRLLDRGDPNSGSLASAWSMAKANRNMRVQEMSS